MNLDPLIGLDDETRPLRSRLLKVPSLRARYLGYVKQLAEQSLDWNRLGPRVGEYRAMIEEAVEADTRKLSSFAAFQSATSPDAVPPPDAGAQPPPPGDGPPRAGGRASLRDFAQRRRAYLLEHPEIKALSERGGR